MNPAVVRRLTCVTRSLQEPAPTERPRRTNRAGSVRRPAAPPAVVTTGVDQGTSGPWPRATSRSRARSPEPQLIPGSGWLRNPLDCREGSCDGCRRARGDREIWDRRADEAQQNPQRRAAWRPDAAPRPLVAKGRAPRDSGPIETECPERPFEPAVPIGENVEAAAAGPAGREPDVEAMAATEQLRRLAPRIPVSVPPAPWQARRHVGEGVRDTLDDRVLDGDGHGGNHGSNRRAQDYGEAPAGDIGARAARRS